MRIPRRLIILLTLASTLPLGGCALSRAQIREADQSVAASISHKLDCTRADHCARSSPLYAQARAALAASQPDRPRHVVTLIERGEDALVARINLIRSARRSIDVQTYIWATDDAGYLMLDELVAAARRGVRVRILADQLGSFNSIDLLADLARTHVNFQLKLYNPSLEEAETQPLEYVSSGLCCFFSLNQRMHNKLLLVDDSIGITGGRNYEDRYFDWGKSFEFRDRDIIVGGPAARAMARSFEIFWNHKRAVPLTHLRDVNRHILADQAKSSHPPGWQTPRFERPDRVEQVRIEAEDSDYLQRNFIDHSMQVGRVDFFSDLPDKTDQPDNPNKDKLTWHLLEIVSGARHELILQTPYLVISDRAEEVLANLRKQHPDIDMLVSTNSLAATDAFVVYALSLKYKKTYLKDLGFLIYEMKPHPAVAPILVKNYAELPGKPASGEASGNPSGDAETTGRYGRVPLTSQGVRLSLHAKSMVVDGRLAMVGSHNFDPRSDHYNTECGVIVHDRAFAQRLRSLILRDTLPQNAWVIAARPQIPLLSRLNDFIAGVSSALPLFDFWPVRYATSYEIKPGCQPLRPSSARFHECYEPVGDFPQVDLPLKTIYTRIVTAFGAGITGIL